MRSCSSGGRGSDSAPICSSAITTIKFSAAKAASKAFVVNRIGDAGFLLAIFLIFINFKTSPDYTKVFAQLGQLSPDMATAIALCLLVGAVGKSAQLPLYTWLRMRWKAPHRSAR